MKKNLLIGTVLATSFLFPLVGCKEEPVKNVEIQVTHTLSEYIDYDNDITSEPLSNTHIKCGKRYKLVYDVNIINKDQYDLDCLLKIHMGSLDNDENRSHQELVHSKEELGGGIGFVTKDDEYSSTFRINNKMSVNWARTYFVLGIDTLGVEGKPYPEDVTLSFNTTSDKYTFLVNNVLSKYNFTLNLIKGDIKFTEENIFRVVDPSKDIYGFQVKAPAEALGIKVDVVQKGDTNVLLGSETFPTTSGYGEIVDVDIVKIIMSQIGEDIFHDLTAGSKSLETLVKITALGGKNYKDITLNKEITIK